MPTPSRTSREEIVTASLPILEAEGPRGLTMQAVAQSVGVKAPSLYKHVRDRDALVLLVTEAALAHLTTRLSQAADLPSLAHAMRGWAREYPESFRLALSGNATQSALDASSQPVLRACARLVGEDQALPAARLVTAWCFGFLTMELGGRFQLGGDIDEAFNYGLERITGSLTSA